MDNRSNTPPPSYDEESHDLIPQVIQLENDNENSTSNSTNNDQTVPEVVTSQTTSSVTPDSPLKLQQKPSELNNQANNEFTPDSKAVGLTPKKAKKTKTNLFDFSRKAKKSNKLHTPTVYSDTDEKKAVLAMLVDRSGSMDSMGSEVSAGCNEYLDTQREMDQKNGTTTHVLFATFDNEYELRRNNSLSEQPKITDEDVKPRGMTALFDSISSIVSDTIKTIDEMKEKPDTVGVFILTDGHENASKNWTKANVTAQIKMLESEPYKWQFYFAAANQDALSTGSSYGMSVDRCMTFDNSKTNLRAAFRSSSQAYYRQKCKMSSAYSPIERSACSTPRK